MTVFRRERDAVVAATETAKKSINTSLVVSCVAVIIAMVALVVAVARG